METNTIKKPPRMTGEREKSYNAFLLYLNLGAERSIEKVAKHLGKAMPSVTKISKKWMWNKRVNNIGVENAENN